MGELRTSVNPLKGGESKRLSMRRRNGTGLIETRDCWKFVDSVEGQGKRNFEGPYVSNDY